MKVFAVVLISVALLHQEASAGPIWDRARRMFGWDKPEEQAQNVAVAPPQHSYGSPQGYPASGPPQKAPAYGPPAPPGGYPAPGAYPRPSYPRPDLQHSSSAMYGSYASPSYAGPTYAKAPGYGPGYGSSGAGYPGAGYPGAGYSGAGYSGSAYPSSGYSGAGYPSVQSSAYGSYPQADYGSSPSASNNYGGLFSVVDQTSQIGQLANGDLAAAPSEPYSSSNEDVMKSLLKMVDKPFDLEAAATAGSHYYQQNPHLAFNPGPHPIMEADRNVIRYRTSPIQIGVADAYNHQHVVGHATGLPSSLSHGIDTSAYASSGLASSGLTSSYGGDLHAAASSAKKSVASASASSHKQ